MYRIILPIVLGLFHVLEANKESPKLCVKAEQNCRDDVFMCGLAFGRFASACGLTDNPMSSRSNQNWSNLASPTPKPCSSECRSAIKGLIRTKRGKELYECDCRLDGDCLVVKARATSCLNMPSNRPYISCTMALWNCTQDPTCGLLQSQFLDDCREMFNGVRCEKKCLKILNELQKTKFGHALTHCECDSSGEAYCRAIRAHSKQLRCMPGMDGLGSPAFVYYTNEPDIQELKTPYNTVVFHSLSWSLLVLVLALLLL